MTEPSPPGRAWLAQELIWILGSLLIGLLLLPGIIYIVGSQLFGIYKGSSIGMGAFYSDYAHDLASSHISAWILAVGPLLLIYMLRLILGMLPNGIDPVHKLFTLLSKKEATRQD